MTPRTLGLAMSALMIAAPALVAQKAKGGQPKPHAVSTVVTMQAEAKPACGAGTGTVGTLSPVQQTLQRNTDLAEKMRARLPAGTNLMTAAAGFDRLGQFISAVNASHHHDLPFDGLKERILYDGMRVGQATTDMLYPDATRSH